MCGQRLGCQGRAGALQSNTPTSPRQRLGLGHAHCAVTLWIDGRGEIRIIDAESVSVGVRGESA